MIIISQDNENIINFGNIEMVGFNPDNAKEIRAFGVSEGYATLGYYKTKERAKEVLQEIINKYKVDESYFSEYPERWIAPAKVYEMPEE